MSIFLFKKILFKENIIPNIIWLSLADIVTRISKLILIVMITRFFSPTVYGQFSFAFNFIILFAMLANFGTGRLIVKELSQSSKFSKELSIFLSFRIITSILSILIALWLTFIVVSDLTVRRLIFLFSGYLLLISLIDFFYAVFQGYQRMKDQALVQILQSMVLVGGFFLVIIVNPKIENIVLLYVISGFISLLVCITLSRYNYKNLYLPKFNISKWKHYLSLSWPIAFIGVLTEVFARLDSVMMGYWNQFTAIGWYNAVYKLISVLFGIGLIFSYAFFPSMARAAKGKDFQFVQLLRLYYIVSLLILIPVIIILFLFPYQIINIVYGPSYLPAVSALKLLIIAFVFAFLLLPLKSIFIISNKQKAFLILLFVTTIINFLINYFLIPKYSLNGAALATVISYFLLFVSSLVWVLKTKILRPN